MNKQFQTVLNQQYSSKYFIYFNYTNILQLVIFYAYVRCTMYVYYCFLYSLFVFIFFALIISGKTLAILLDSGTINVENLYRQLRPNEFIQYHMIPFVCVCVYVEFRFVIHLKCE